MKVIPESDKKKAVELYSTGNYSLKQVGEKFNVTEVAILKWMKNFGVENVRRRGRWHGREDMNKQVVECYLRGDCVESIIKQFNITDRTVYDLVKKAGHDTRGGIAGKYGINDNIKQKAIELYKANHSCNEISKMVNVSSRSIWDWVKEIRKTASEISAIGSFQGKKRGLGEHCFIETRFGIIRCDSSYEKLRVIQLERELSIISIERCPFIIPYKINGKTRNYNPDLYIKYQDGRKIVEEVKNSNTKELPINTVKHNYAIKFLSELGIEFRIVTEKETNNFTTNS